MVMNLTAFKEKFNRYSHPYWKVYQGRRIGRQVLEKNLDMENLDESWDMLEQIFSWYPTGTFTVLLLPSPSAKNETGVISVVQLGSGEVAGIGNATGATQPMNQWQQMFQMMAMMKQYATPDLTGIEARIEQKYKIQRLEEQLEHGEPMSAKERMMESMADALPMAISGMFGIPMAPMAPPPTAQIGVAGQKETTEQVAPKTEAKNRRYPDLNRLAVFAGNMQQRYPKYYVNDLLDAFFKYATDNPAMADQVVAQIIAHAQNTSTGG